MSESVRVELLPLGETFTVEPGGPLQEHLFLRGVEFPCGGRGRCKGCRVKVLAGETVPTAEERRLLGEADVAAGWRLACCLRPRTHLKLELAQWEAAILSDTSGFAFTPRDGLGVAIDLGTTTIVAQLLDLGTGDVRAVRMALNSQARHGADVMSRIEFALAGDGQKALESLIRRQLGDLVAELLRSAAASPAALRDIVLVGNTVMHHLFCGVSVEPLAHHPFTPSEDGLKQFRPAALGWDLPPGCTVRFLPCLGGFVGSDILAGVLATGLHERDSLAVLVDLGTNGEIVAGHRGRLLCASTAAGPAFEGARISMGMRAATGAISEVTVREGKLCCRVLGNAPARGLCGSGLVDAVTAGLELGWIQPSGRLTHGSAVVLEPPVSLTQADIRELQLAKGAIAAGIRLLLDRLGASLADVARVHLAGAFGNYINRTSAQRIGLMQFAPERVEPSGNTALLGAKLALFGLADHDGSFAELRRQIQHVPLNEDPAFHEVYVDLMTFPS
jgi:uncharacterized 2Fe-2S/4Fe-4S cluster protein (DUF4445 family)